MDLKTSLSGLVLAAVMATGIGCRSMPTPCKYAIAPLTVARDVVDMPLAAMSTFWVNVAESGKERFGDTDASTGFGSHGFSIGTTTDVTYPVGYGLSRVFGAPDYVLCRSVWPNFPKGLSPWKEEDKKWWSEFLFPNTRELFAEPGDPEP